MNNNSNLNYPGGLTDGPPYALSGHQLANHFLNSQFRPEGEFPDGSYWHCSATIDMDYLMGFLLLITTRNEQGTTTDYMAIFLRHGKGPKGWDFDIEWLMQPLIHSSPDWGGRYRRAHHWFVDWVAGRS